MTGTTLQSLLAQIALGEDSTRQFKADVKNADSLASEMAAFANTSGGNIFIGVADDGSTPGLSGQDVARINQLISNGASQLVRSPLAVQTENVALENGRIVIVLTVPKGIDKPYFDKNGVIWLKAGSDKRRVNSKEELRRLFQFTNQFHADELPTKAGIDKLDKLRFRDFLRDVHKQEYPDSPAELTRLLQNMNLATDDGRLNLAGVLLFAEQPEWIVPQFVVKAIRYPGNKIHTTDYLDTEDFSGPLPKLFESALAFVMRNLHKVQAGCGVNAPGLPYHGLGSGIKRALEKWPAIDFADDHDGCLFTATVHRKPVEELDLADKGALKVQIKGRPAPIKASLSNLQVQLIDFIRSNPDVSYDELADMTQKDRTTVMRNIGKLKDAGILRRVGSKKTGHWEVIE